MSKKPPFQKPQIDLGEISPYMSLLFRIGINMIVFILAGFFAGFMLITKLNAPKFLLIACVAIGVGFGFYRVYKEITKLDQYDLDRPKRKDSNGKKS